MATPSDELFCRARIVGNGTAPPVHSMGGVRSSFDPSPTAVALAASCLARLAIAVEILPWACPLTAVENWLQVHAGGATYEGGFLFHYLDVLVYPDVPPGLLTACGVAVCLFNLGIYIARYRRRHVASW